jgi:hypothetical protein
MNPFPNPMTDKNGVESFLSAGSGEQQASKQNKI